jgi:cytochrome c oxidase subunit 2
VCVIIAVLLWIAIAGAVARGGADETRATALSEDRGGHRWITIGLALSAVPLLATLVWTMAALARIVAPTGPAPIAIDVTGHRWWWEARYHGATPADGFTTANEIHIPTGVPVTIRLQGGDVIHSFWVPKLAGKTDAIPGQRNVAWLQADRPGRYRGQCSEFCGAQHAKMGFEIVAEPRDAFDRWRAAQRLPAPLPVTEPAKQGLALLPARCGQCHTVRGTSAAGKRGPDLTHLMSRRTIAGALLPNTIGSLAGWVQDPQAIKPGSLMPEQKLTGPQLGNITAYLGTLR